MVAQPMVRVADARGRSSPLPANWCTSRAPIGPLQQRRHRTLVVRFTGERISRIDRLDQSMTAQETTKPW